MYGCGMHGWPKFDGKGCNSSQTKLRAQFIANQRVYPSLNIKVMKQAGQLLRTNNKTFLTAA